MNKLVAAYMYAKYKLPGTKTTVWQLLAGNDAQRRLGLAKMRDRKELASNPAPAGVKEAIKQVHDTLQAITVEKGLQTGAYWHSNALREEIALGFDRIVQALPPQSVDYLEIGSCQGASMALVAHFLRNSNRLGTLTSVDPYLENGYLEDDGFVPGLRKPLKYDKTIKSVALELYRRMALDVEVVEQVSQVGLPQLSAQGRQFDLVYVDGNHGGLFPTVDVGLCAPLLKPGAILILDDHHYPDVTAVKIRCDMYLEKVFENWKLAAYRWRL